MPLQFEWDAAKDAANVRTHRVGFAEAATVFGDPRSLTIDDPEHSDDEDRWVILGISNRGRLLVVVFTERTDTIRLITARRANRRETNDYAKS